MDSVEKLGQEIAELAAHLDAATQQLLARVRAFDEAGGWERQGAISCAHWLSWRLGLDTGTAREKVRVARALGALSRIDAAFGRGELSYAKVRALTRVATAENEPRLLELAPTPRARSSSTSAGATVRWLRPCWTGDARRGAERTRAGASGWNGEAGAGPPP